MINNLVYILIFLPIFSAIIVQLCGNSKVAIRIVTFSTLLLAIAISSMIAIESFYSTSTIQSDLSFDIISLATEFRVNAVLSSFVVLLTIIKIVQLGLFQGFVSKKMRPDQLRLYFSSHLISYFAIVGIVISNNIFNIFIFIELYFVSYFSLSIMHKNKKISRQSSGHMVLNIASSMLFLLSITALYFHFEALSLVELVSKVESSLDSSALVQITCSLITVSLLIRFIPLWVLFSKNIKDSVAISSELFFLLFINLNLLICILLKTYYIVFSSDIMASVIVFSCLAIITYSSFVMVLSRHLRSQITLFCLSVFCFVILSLALRNQSSFEASLFYILIYNIVALAIFSFIIFIWNNYNISVMEDVSVLNQSSGFLSRNSHLLFLLIIILSIPLPHSPVFYANFFLFDAILDNNDDQLYEFSNLFDPYILITILLFHIGSLILFLKMIISLIYQSKTFNKKVIDSKERESIAFCLINLIAAIILLYSLVNPDQLQVVVDRFSRNLFNIL